MEKPSAALIVLTSWDNEAHGTTTQPTRTIIKHLKEKTLQSENISEFYCTTLDVEVSEDQKKDAESVGVTLIPATRIGWLDPQEDPPGLHWLVHHGTYYPGLRKLKNIQHVVGYSPHTKNVAATFIKTSSQKLNFINYLFLIYLLQVQHCLF